jgi:hypothetical protein
MRGGRDYTTIGPGLENGNPDNVHKKSILRRDI